MARKMGGRKQRARVPKGGRGNELHLPRARAVRVWWLTPRPD